MPQLRHVELKLQQPETDTDKVKHAQHSLITLHQRLQATAGAVRANPFLAFRDAVKRSASDTESSGQKTADTQAQGVWLPDAMKAFETNTEEEREATKAGGAKTGVPLPLYRSNKVTEARIQQLTC